MDQRVRQRSFRPSPLTSLDRLVLAGAGVYERAQVLPRLLPVGPEDLAGPEPALGRRICLMLLRALRAERNRGRAGHWTYSLNRHIGLMQALKAERLALATAARRMRLRPRKDDGPDGDGGGQGTGWRDAAMTDAATSPGMAGRGVAGIGTARAAMMAAADVCPGLF